MRPPTGGRVADGDFSDAERRHVKATLRREFGLGPTEAAELVRAAERARDEAPGPWHFTNAIVESYSASQKTVLADIMHALLHVDGDPRWQEDCHEGADRHEMTVSAAGAFVLRAMRSEKVTLFGEPTGSSIDYQCVSIVRFGCREAGLYLGYPTVVGSDELPRGGVRPTGIAWTSCSTPASPIPWPASSNTTGGPVAAPSVRPCREVSRSHA